MGIPEALFMQAMVFVFVTFILFVEEAPYRWYILSAVFTVLSFLGCFWVAALT